METDILSEETITFGKYQNLTVNELLRDRKYCDWLLKQKWFEEQYEYLFNRVKEYDPQSFFFDREYKELPPGTNILDFTANYKFFNLLSVKDVKVKLKEEEKKCYSFYLEKIENIKERIYNELSFNIKAPVRWLKEFEKKHGLSRDVFKEFLSAYDLPNIPYIVEDVKKMGGIDYKGARSFIIAKERSLNQEKFWEDLLKEKYGEDIGKQFRYRNCIFDCICIKNNTLYECKLGMKDFNHDQHNKYLLTLGTYALIYLIDYDCVVNLQEKCIYTTDVEKYTRYLLQKKKRNKFESFILSFEIKKILDLKQIV